ncbi:MAG: hypothetical protein CL927_11485 [Deltaproteobacteria bacterium]|nr:hypothetical protein [Deltaproteobacteria bacterium]HCH65575.1 hypothetical protein [Deltaproteobacteria bacterium]
MMKTNKIYRAHRLVIDLLTANPDDPDLHAMYAAVLVKGGQYGDAVHAFDGAKGSEWYEERGLPFHATALAKIGRVEEAARLRREFELAGRKQSVAALNIGLEVVDDYIAGGRGDLAVERARLLITEFPNSPRTFGGLAAALVADGQLLEASWCIERAKTLGNTEIFPIEMARIEWLIAMGEYSAAWELHRDYYRKRRFDTRIWRQRLELLRRTGDPIECRAVADQARFQWSLDPQFYLEASRCESDLGDDAAAKERVRALLPAYAEHPDVRARAERLGISDEL